MVNKLLAKRQELQQRGQAAANIDYKSIIDKEVAAYAEKITAKYETEKATTLISIRDQINLIDELLNEIENDKVEDFDEEETYN